MTRLALALCELVCAAAVAPESTVVHDPVVDEAKGLIEKGEFAEARRLLEDRSDNPSAAVARARDEQIEIMRRIRLDFCTGEADMLDKIRQAIPDATSVDLARWRAEGNLQFRTIDGQVWYFGREPGNLFRFSQEARRRREAAGSPVPTRPAKRPEFSLLAHLAEIVALADRTDAVELLPVRHRVTCTIALRPRAGRLRAGARVRIWMIYPQVYRQQRDVRLVRTSIPVKAFAPNWDLASGGQLQRTIYFEHRVEDPQRPVRVEAVYEWTCAAYYPRLDPDMVRPYDTAGELYREYTRERPPHIVFAPEIRRIVETEAAGVPNPLERARRLWLWVARNIPWAAEVEYSTIPSICLKGIRTRRGDCGVQGLTFITLCRAAGIPARWQSGWETKPSGYTMHDWAELYVEPWGWLPADPSYGLQESEDPRIREFFFGHMDSYRCIANLDYGCPLVPPKESLRSEPVDFQRGEVEVDGENLYFDEWDYSFDVEWTSP